MAKMTIALTGSTATTLAMTFGNLADDGKIELQVSPSPRFEFCICPVYSIPRGANYNLAGLNQLGSYFLRARDRRTDGSTQGWGAVAAARLPASGGVWV